MTELTDAAGSTPSRPQPAQSQQQQGPYRTASQVATPPGSSAAGMYYASAGQQQQQQQQQQGGGGASGGSASQGGAGGIGGAVSLAGLDASNSGGAASRATSGSGAYGGAGASMRGGPPGFGGRGAGESRFGAGDQRRRDGDVLGGGPVFSAFAGCEVGRRVILCAAGSVLALGCQVLPSTRNPARNIRVSARTAATPLALSPKIAMFPSHADTLRPK